MLNLKKIGHCCRKSLCMVAHSECKVSDFCHLLLRWQNCEKQGVKGGEERRWKFCILVVPSAEDTA